MLRSIPLILLLALTGCQSAPETEDEGRFYSYVDAQGNLVTVEKKPGDEPAGSASREAASSSGQGASHASAGKAAEKGGQPPGRAADGLDPEQYQTPEEAKQRMREKVQADERDRFVSYPGPEGEMINRPLDLVAEREAAEERQRRQAPEFEELPDQSRFKEGTSRVPADCCRHLIADAALLERGDQITLRFARPRSVRLGRERPAHVLRLDPEVGELEIRSFMRNDQYLAPRLLVLDAEGMPVLKVNNVFTRHYPENWARHGYMSGRIERSADFAYVVFYLPYGVMGEQGPKMDPEAGPDAGEFRRALSGELAVTGRRLAPARPRQ